jgi:heme oxygenase (biliverdin-IX-beta and delta-forming)
VNRHAGPPRGGNTPSVPEPTYAERARTLAYLVRSGSLATLSRKHAGHPFASVMPYALDEQGQPLVLISSMAIHTQNLQADPRASLLVAQPINAQSQEAGDPLAAARLTLLGDARQLSGPDREKARETYLARHPRASYWADFDDFSFWRLDVKDVYYVGGFAAMDWVTAVDYRAARPDPLADAGPGILEHMNRDHADALIAYARHFARETADEATMIAVDRLGFRLRLRSGDRLHAVRIAFPREIRSAAESRSVLIEMLAQARAGSPSRP